jgi:hypothetical protein
MSSDNAFITLTFNDLHLPSNRSLDLVIFQKFMKRLRKKVGLLKFFHCGEYGELEGRPHYHACIFGYDFPDKKHWKTTNKIPVYRSAILEKLWTDPKTGLSLGYSSTGSVTFQSAAYVARYITKKVTGDAAQKHYEYTNPETGEITQKKPEYTTMSNGIGQTFFEKYHGDIYPHDFVVANGGKKMRPPKYYDSQYEILDPQSFQKVKRKRKTDSKKHVDNNTPARLRVRESLQNQKLKLLPRNLE